MYIVWLELCGGQRPLLREIPDPPLNRKSKIADHLQQNEGENSYNCLSEQ